MATGQVITTVGKKAMLHRNYEVSPTYSPFAYFEFGTGTNTPAVGDTIIQTPIALKTGTNTSATAFKLIDSGASFITNGIIVGCVVKNTTDNTYSSVVSVDSQTQLTLKTNIFPTTPKGYAVYSTKPVVVGTPTFDDTNLVATSQGLLLTTDGNGNSITEFGLVNTDGPPSLFSHAVFTAITKTTSVQVLFTEKDKVT